jgi:hypothetical protein
VFDQAMEKVLSTQWSFLIVGAGGFGGKRSSDQLIPIVDPPKRKPDTSLQYRTSIDQVKYFPVLKKLNGLFSSLLNKSIFIHFVLSYFKKLPNNIRPLCTA